MSEEEGVSAPVDSRRAPPPLTSNNKWIDDGRRCHHDNINIDRPHRRALLSELASFVCCTVVFVVCCPSIAATKADSAQDQPDGSKVLTGYEDIGIASLCGRFSRKDISGSSSRISADRRSRRDVGCLGKSFLKQRGMYIV